MALDYESKIQIFSDFWSKSRSQSKQVTRKFSRRFSLVDETFKGLKAANSIKRKEDRLSKKNLSAEKDSTRTSGFGHQKI